MKPFILILAVLATGCTTMDKFVCTGTGTCMANGSYAGSSARYVSPVAQQVQLPNGGYMIVRSQSTGQIMSVIQTSKTK